MTPNSQPGARKAKSFDTLHWFRWRCHLVRKSSIQPDERIDRAIVCGVSTPLMFQPEAVGLLRLDTGVEAARLLDQHHAAAGAEAGQEHAGYRGSLDRPALLVFSQLGRTLALRTANPAGKDYLAWEVFTRVNEAFYIRARDSGTQSQGEPREVPG